jgi:hypothetical protein
MKRKTMTVVAALAILALPAQVLAAGLCIQVTGGWSYTFPKVKKLKPGSAIALNGYWNGGAIGAVDGTAYADADGVVYVGLTVHRMDGTNITYTETAKTNLDFAGPSHIDTDMDGASDATSTWTKVECP